MSDETSVVVPDGGGISISSSDGTDVEVSNDASLTVTSLLGDETESAAEVPIADSAPVQNEGDAILVSETNSAQEFSSEPESENLPEMGAEQENLEILTESTPEPESSNENG